MIADIDSIGAHTTRVELYGPSISFWKDVSAALLDWSAGKDAAGPDIH